MQQEYIISEGDLEQIKKLDTAELKEARQHLDYLKSMLEQAPNYFPLSFKRFRADFGFCLNDVNVFNAVSAISNLRQVIDKVIPKQLSDLERIEFELDTELENYFIENDKYKLFENNTLIHKFASDLALLFESVSLSNLPPEENPNFQQVQILGNTFIKTIIKVIYSWDMKSISDKYPAELFAKAIENKATYIAYVFITNYATN
jgi:hypothetical protein